ncbi:MAG: hypothetical protein AAGA77_23315 [Bacteroidota bacterium]
MKTLNYLKYFLFVVFGAALIISCSKDDSADELINSSGEIELRNNDSDSIDPDADCFVKLCLDIIPNTANPQFTDIITVTVGNDVWSISNNVVTLPNGSTTSVINNQYCFSIPVSAVTSVVVFFHGYGGVKVTGSWNNGDTFCDLYKAQWPGTFKAPLNVQEELNLTCEAPCPQPPLCEIDLCVTFIEGDPADNYNVDLPNGGGSVTISNGQVTIITPAGIQQFPLPPDGVVCATVPLTTPSSTATISFNGTGSAVLQGTWPDGTTCELFSAGVCDPTFVHPVEDVTLTCDAPCPAPECEIEACITFIAGDPSDNYTLELPTVGDVIISNGMVTLPNGCQIPLPPDGTICTTLPIFAPTTALLTYNGSGSVVINVTYEDGTECTVFQAGVNSDLNLHITDAITLDCNAECPVIPECYVNLCLELTDPLNVLYKVQILGLGSVIISNGTVIPPSGPPFPFPASGELCLDLPVIPGFDVANISFSGPGSATATVTYPDLLECVVFNAPDGSGIAMPVKQDVQLTCEGDCGPLPEFCEIEICANFAPATPDDIYMVEFESGAQLTIQNGIVTLPSGMTEPYNGVQFCAPIFIEVGTFESAKLSFKGTGEVFTTLEYSDGGNCTIFSAGQGTSTPVKKGKKVTLGCDPIC